MTIHVVPEEDCRLMLKKQKLHFELDKGSFVK